MEEGDAAENQLLKAVAAALPDKKRVHKVISGGQTGADRAGLEAATRMGIPTGGTAAPGYSTSAGKDPSLKRFGLIACSTSGRFKAAGYINRTKQNVDDGDATLAFRTHSSSGTDKTIGYCISGKWECFKCVTGGASVWTVAAPPAYRPVCVVTNMEAEGAVDQVQAFLQTCNVAVLNVAGHRDDGRGFQADVYDFLLRALKQSP